MTLNHIYQIKQNVKTESFFLIYFWIIGNNVFSGIILGKLAQLLGKKKVPMLGTFWLLGNIYYFGDYV